MPTLMKTTTILAAALACSLTAGIAAAQDAPKMTTPIPADITTPDTVESHIGTLKFHDGFPTDETVQTVYDNLAFQRGVQTFLTALPGGSMEAFRQGLASIGVNDNQSIAIFEDPSRSFHRHLQARQCAQKTDDFYHLSTCPKSPDRLY
ncbi:MAG: hypothetical protein ACSLE2_14255 [Lysobacterales bacterium]